MNLQLVQKCIQAGYVFDESSLDEIYIDRDLIQFILNNVPNIIKELEDIFEVIRENKEYGPQIAEVNGKEDLISDWSNFYEVSELYSILEEDPCFMYIEKKSEDILNMYLKHMNSYDTNYNNFKKAVNFLEYSLEQFKANDPLDEEEIVKFLDNYLYDEKFTKEVCLSQGFQRSFDNFPTDKYGWCETKYDTKHNYAWDMIERFGSEEVEDKFISYQDGIYEDTFLSEEEKYELKKKEQLENLSERTRRFENAYSRLQQEDCEWYLNEHTFSKEICVHEGHIGLEDMRFSYITIDGEIQGETFNHQAWINNREFGDYQLQTKFFLDTVNKYLVLTF